MRKTKKTATWALLIATSSCDGAPLDDEAARPSLAESLRSVELAQEAAPDQDSRTWEVVHVTVRDLAGKGEELGRSEEGAWDHAMWRKAARPDPLRDGLYLFREEARLEELPDGRVRSTLTLLRAPNDVVEDEGDAPSPPKLDESEVLEPAEDGRLHLAVELAGFPAWDVPLEVPRGVFGEEADLRAEAERAEGFARREALFHAMKVPVVALLGALDGRLGRESWTSGWVGVHLPEERLAELLASPLVSRVSSLDVEAGSSDWIHGDAGQSTRYHSDAFNAAGYTGEDGPTIGVIELGLLDDEACFLADLGGCADDNRLLARSDCSDPSTFPSGECDPVTDLDDENDTLGNVQHATTVVGIAAADYTDNQGSGHELGDDTWTSGAHSTTWKDRSTSIAPEIELRFAGNIGTASGAAEAVDDMSAGGARIVNMSFWYGGGECHPLASGAVDLAVENLFDDGRLAVISTDNDPNDDGNPFGPCDVKGQAALPKALAVAALGEGDCEGDYAHECQIRVEAAANGGADIQTPNNVTRTGALSLIGLVAVDGALYRSDTDCNDPASRGLVHDGLGPLLPPVCGHPGIGSSFAAPVVTAAAALVHEWATDRFGPTPVDGVGRLHALMLGMGDSHDLDEGDSLTEQRATRAERRFGMGRLKLKRPTIALLTGATLTDAAPTASFFVSGSALPSGTDFAKCVALQHEDLSSKSVVSDVDLILQRRTSVGGTCTMLGTSEISALVDDSYDIKKMAAFRTNMGGNCLRVTLDADDVAGSSMNVSLFCYASSEDDDEPN